MGGADEGRTAALAGRCMRTSRRERSASSAASRPARKSPSGPGGPSALTRVCVSLCGCGMGWDGGGRTRVNKGLRQPACKHAWGERQAR